MKPKSPKYKTPASNFVFNNQSYQLQTRQCNKAVCKCHNGKPHGPYWYLNGSKYLGKQLPQDILINLAQVENNKERIKKVRAEVNMKYLHLQKELADISDQVRAIENLLNGGVIDNEELKKAGLQIFKTLI